MAHLGVQQQSLSALATWIEMVCLKSPLQGSIYTDTEVEFQPSLGDHKPAIELQGFIANVSNVAQRFKDVAADPTAKPICHLHTACLTQVVGLLTSHPLPYPRFFYQSLQQTRLKLAVSPQPRAQGEPVAVNTSQFLAVKVEGVIQRSKAVKGAEEGRQVAFNSTLVFNTLFTSFQGGWSDGDVILCSAATSCRQQSKGNQSGDERHTAARGETTTLISADVAFIQRYLTSILNKLS